MVLRDKLGNYIEKLDRHNSDLHYGIDDVCGITNTKQLVQGTKANLIGRTFEKFSILSPREYIFNRRTSRNGEKISLGYNKTDREWILTEDYCHFRVRKDKENILDPDFLYLFFLDTEFDRYARFNSWGSATEFFNWEEIIETPILILPINEQHKIVHCYEVLSNRITLLEKINNVLETQVSVLYAELIHGKEQNGILSDIANICSGKRPTNTREGDIPLVGAGGIMGYIESSNYNEPILVTGRVGTHGVIQRFNDQCWASDNTLVIKCQFYEFAYQFLRTVDYSSLNRGSTQPLITQSDLKNLPLVIPQRDDLDIFESKASVVMHTYSLNQKEIGYLNEMLCTLVDSLTMRYSS